MKMYSIHATDRFKKEFRKLDKYTQKMLRAWINKSLVNIEDPRSIGKALVSNRKGEWRYRIGDYRLICEINDNELVILALSIGHRREVYKK